MLKKNDFQSVPTEREFISGLVTTGLVILAVAVAISVFTTWYTTRSYAPLIHLQALRTAAILPLIIVPLCVAIVGFQASVNFRRMLSVYRLAHTDEMTNLANRRAFMQRGRDLFEQADLDYAGLCVFIVDLDHFKKVNDAYGHEAGDEVLIYASQQIVNALPERAMVARLGGEEFGVLVPYDNVTEIHRMAEAIRSKVAARPCVYKDQKINVSASVGVGIAHSRDTIGSVMTRADHALYEAKNAGRNRFVVAA